MRGSVAPAAGPMLEALDQGDVPGLLTIEDGAVLTQTEQGDAQGVGA